MALKIHLRNQVIINYIWLLSTLLMTSLENEQKTDLALKPSRPKPTIEKKSMNSCATNVKKDLSSKMSFLSPPSAPGTSYLDDLASVIRSKNAGPYELTFDIMFAEDEIYFKVKGCGVLNQSTVARLYKIEESDVIACLFWDPARAFKATIKRQTVSGGYGETDTHGSQQHAPFLYLVMPISRV